VRSAGAAEIAAACHLRLDLGDDPALVPLETLDGRDHYLLPPTSRLGAGKSLPPGDLGRVLLGLPVRAAQQPAPVGGAKDED
jgi:hypothetical protein